MKKYLAMILALVMALSLVACGDKKDVPAAPELPAAAPRDPALTDADSGQTPKP